MIETSQRLEPMTSILNALPAGREVALGPIPVVDDRLQINNFTGQCDRVMLRVLIGDETVTVDRQDGAQFQIEDHMGNDSLTTNTPLPGRFLLEQTVSGLTACRRVLAEDITPADGQPWWIGNSDVAVNDNNRNGLSRFFVLVGRFTKKTIDCQDSQSAPAAQA